MSRLPQRLIDGQIIHAHMRPEGKPSQAPALLIDVENTGAAMPSLAPGPTLERRRRAFSP